MKRTWWVVLADLAIDLTASLFTLAVLVSVFAVVLGWLKGTHP